MRAWVQQDGVSQLPSEASSGQIELLRKRFLTTAARLCPEWAWSDSTESDQLLVAVHMTDCKAAAPFTSSEHLCVSEHSAQVMVLQAC